jgi:hypothetical protein
VSNELCVGVRLMALGVAMVVGLLVVLKTA